MATANANVHPRTYWADKEKCQVSGSDGSTILATEESVGSRIVQDSTCPCVFQSTEGEMRRNTWENRIGPAKGEEIPQKGGATKEPECL